MKVIEVINISKIYRIGIRENKPESLGGYLWSILSGPFRNFKKLQQLTNFHENDSENTIWAVNEVSFEVRKGEVLGIIGHNGAGKSTLLKMLSRITDPTSGKIKITGSVASLLEVGTGFHPELTGRENIYLNGTLLGMNKKEVDAKLDEIISFAEVGKFVDTPVKRYSSGMKVRLAFAVAAHLDAEILIIDEVLAVGDADFQKKCLGKMNSLADSGRTVLFVSHNMEAIKQFCQACLLIDKGRLLYKGTVEACVEKYLNLNQNKNENLVIENDPNLSAQLLEINVGDSKHTTVPRIVKPEPVVFRITYRFNAKIKDAFVLFRITTVNGTALFTVTDSDEAGPLHRFSRGLGKFRVRFAIDSKFLQPGTYSFIGAIYTPGKKVIHRVRLPFTFTISASQHDEDWFLNKAKGGFLNLKAKWEIEQFEQGPVNRPLAHE